MELFSGNAVIHFLGMSATVVLCALGLWSVTNRGLPKNATAARECVYTILGVVVSSGLFLIFNILWEDFVKNGTDSRLFGAYFALGSMGFMLIRTVAHATATKELLSWRRYTQKEMLQRTMPESQRIGFTIPVYGKDGRIIDHWREHRQRTVVVLGDMETWDYLDNCIKFKVPVDKDGKPYGGNAQVEDMVEYVGTDRGPEVEIDSFERAS